jgi:hypothetical protein
MQISEIFSFLVDPSKHEDEQPEIGGAKLPLDGNLYYCGGSQKLDNVPSPGSHPKRSFL